MTEPLTDTQRWRNYMAERPVLEHRFLQIILSIQRFRCNRARALLPEEVSDAVEVGVNEASLNISRPTR